MLRRLLFPLLAAALALAAMSGVPASDATFVSTSTYGAQVSAAADWAAPTVSVTSPGANIAGTTTISATAADTGTGVASVVIAYSTSDSGTWTTLCTDTSAPYSCSWATTGVADGSYDLVAIATDNASFTATSETVTTRVANNLQVVLAPIADPVRGSVTLKADYLNPSPTIALKLYFEYVAAGGNNWTAVPGCGNTGATSTTRTCTWASTVTGDYDIRAVGTNGGSTTLYDYQYGVTIDNTAPSVALTVPTGTLSGTVRMSATATDADAGMDSVAFQYRKTGAASFTTACTVSGTPYACSLNTTALTDGGYDFRAIGTDLAGNTTTTATQTRTVDNTISSVSITSPSAGATVRGTVSVTADASSNRGVSKVVFETRATGTSTWTALCTTTTSPYTCAWNTSAIVTGNYDLHAVLTDGGGTVTTSATVAVSIDNSTLRAQDIQATNVTTVGKPAAGDRLLFTYSNTVNPATILAGWTGASTSISVTFKDAKVPGAPVAGQDYATFGSVNLGSVSFPESYVKANKSAVFAATMVASTQTVAGVSVTVVTVTLGTTTGGANITTATQTGTMTWTPSTAARTLGGVACSATAATESGTLDKDL
ncbi:MAG: Ig-like domain-containing protein [Nocardioides sp.]